MPELASGAEWRRSIRRTAVRPAPRPAIAAKPSTKVLVTIENVTGVGNRRMATSNPRARIDPVTRERLSQPARPASPPRARNAGHLAGGRSDIAGYPRNWTIDSEATRPARTQAVMTLSAVTLATPVPRKLAAGRERCRSRCGAAEPAARPAGRSARWGPFNACIPGRLAWGAVAAPNLRGPAARLCSGPQRTRRHRG